MAEYYGVTEIKQKGPTPIYDGKMYITQFQITI